MKKLFTTAIALIFLCAGVFANKIISIGHCGDVNYVRTQTTNAGSNFEVRVQGSSTILLSFDTRADGHSGDSTFAVDVPIGTVLEIRYKYFADTEFSDWVRPFEILDIKLEGCTVLPIQLSNLSVSDGKVRFNSGNESNIKSYNIQASVDAVDWVTVESIKPDGSKGYASKKLPKPIGSILTGIFIFGLLVTMFDRENKDRSKHRKYLSLIALLLMVGFYSCKKESVNKPDAEYKFARVQQSNMDGTFFYSEVKNIKP